MCRLARQFFHAPISARRKNAAGVGLGRRRGGFAHQDRLVAHAGMRAALDAVRLPKRVFPHIFGDV